MTISRCTATKSSGWRCPRRAIKGKDKCRLHGGLMVGINVTTRVHARFVLIIAKLENGPKIKGFLLFETGELKWLS